MNEVVLVTSTEEVMAYMKREVQNTIRWFHTIFPRSTYMAYTPAQDEQVSVANSNQHRFLQLITGEVWNVIDVRAGKLRVEPTRKPLDIDLTVLHLDRVAIARYRRLGKEWFDDLILGTWPSQNPTTEQVLVAVTLAMNEALTARFILHTASSNSLFNIDFGVN